MLAEEIQHEPGAHNRKGYVGLAVANMEMASRDTQGIVAAFSIQMDSNHVDISSRKVQVKPEPSSQPAALLVFHLDVETKLGIGPKLDFYAHQFLQSSFEGVEPGALVRLLQPATVCLFRQIMTKLSTKHARRIDGHLRETQLIGVLAVSGQLL
jgi:hypothetical protein